jgi:hypothetical protein
MEAEFSRIVPLFLETKITMANIPADHVLCHGVAGMILAEIPSQKSVRSVAGY